jgi:hypothetical protein
MLEAGGFTNRKGTFGQCGLLGQQGHSEQTGPMGYGSVASTSLSGDRVCRICSWVGREKQRTAR